MRSLSASDVAGAESSGVTKPTSSKLGKSLAARGSAFADGAADSGASDAESKSIEISMSPIDSSDARGGITGGATASVQVTTTGGNSPVVSLNLRPAQPEVFNSGGAALALNQDNSVNSPQNPAAPGSIITIFASGAGGLYSSQPEGSIPSEPGGGPVLPVAVLLNNRSLEVLYAGNAPGLVINLLQINLRLPQQGAGGEFQLMIGGFFSDPFSLAVQ